MPERWEQAFERAISRPLHPPPAVPPEADHAEREQSTVYALAYEMARRHLEWAAEIDRAAYDGERVEG